MAINRITAPGVTPATFWPQVINQLAALVIDKEDNERISGGFVKQGSLFNVGGVMYIADADTAISGTRDTGIAIKITPAGATASASYASSISGVSWNGAYKGYYDVSGNLYIYNAVAGDYIRDGMSLDLATSDYNAAGITRTVKVNLIGRVRLVAYGSTRAFNYISINRNGTNILSAIGGGSVDTICMESDIFTISCTWVSYGFGFSIRTDGFGIN